MMEDPVVPDDDCSILVNMNIVRGLLNEIARCGGTMKEEWLWLNEI
jgi:hypothetical protein